MDLLGKALSHYRLDRLLAEGSMGTVYQAYDLSMQRDVAVKVIHPRYARQPGFREGFAREVSAAAQLNHPGLVKVLDFGQDKDQLYIVMEYLPGPTLRQLLDDLIRQREWVSLKDAVRLIGQLCDTIDYAHRHGSLHWDINPANLMIRPRPAAGLPFRLVLIDLQLARLLETLADDQDRPALGMPAYMSPEETRGSTPDLRSNIYSLGVLLYELVVGILPLPVKTVAEARLYHARGDVPPAPRSIRPDLPESLERIMMRALAKEPAERFASAAQMGAALAATMGEINRIPEREGATDGNLFREYRESLPQGARPEPAAGQTEVWPSFATERTDLPFVEQARLEVHMEGRPPRTFVIEKDRLTIGRDHDNDLVLDDPRISRRHTELTRAGSTYYVTDLNSANGTYLDNDRVPPGIPTLWRPQQELKIGGFSLRLFPAGTRAGSYGAGSHTVMAGVEPEPIILKVTPQELTLDAGESVTVTLSLLNQGFAPDSFSLTLTGIPADWISNLPPHVELMRGEQKVIPLTLAIPRLHQSRAGRHVVTIRATSQRDPGQTAELKLALTVAPFSEFRAELQPPRLQAGQIGRIVLTNLGNIHETFTVRFTDATGALVFEPAEVQIRIPPAGMGFAEFRAQESHPRLLGGQQIHAIRAVVSAPTAESQIVQGELLSFAYLPAWVLPGVLLLCLFLAAAAAALFLLFNRSATLTVVKEGEGTVSSSPAGIDCGSICEYNFNDNTSVTLSAEPAPTYTFGGWSGGGCSGVEPCTVSMRTDQTITAIFNPPGSKTLAVFTTGTGTGTVSSVPPGITNCAGTGTGTSTGTCTFAFTDNATVTLTALPSGDSTFGGWGGACSGTSPTCTVTMSDVQTVIASFNLPGQKSLTVIKNGNGTITSTPPGINCGSTCTFDFDDNTPVTLTAAATSPSVFGGWSGACSGTALTCTVTMNAAQTVTATFNTPGNQTLTVTKSGAGTGTISSFPSGIDNCNATCSAAFAFNTLVRLTANPTAPSIFGGWGGACASAGTGLTCDVTMSEARSVTATFNAPGNQTLTVTKSGSGTGTVSSFPGGIDNCSTTCSAGFAFNTLVRLTANPTSSSTFGGWGGACASAGTTLTCDVTINEAKNVTATFNAPSNQTLTVTKSGAGTGTVSSFPGGIDNCSTTCSAAFAFNTVVRLTANPTSPSTFAGWGGACASAGTGLTCDVTMSEARSVTAAFNAPPQITSNGGGDQATIEIPENTTTVTTVVVSDPDTPAQPLTYSLGGADAAQFSINQATGALTFRNNPDFENPTDVQTPIDPGMNNVYWVQVRVTDSFGAFDEQTLRVVVTDVPNG